jgi:hypothetical protein
MEFSGVAPICDDTILVMTPQVNIHHDEVFIVTLAQRGDETDAHLRACPRCREMYDFFRMYLEAEARELNRPMTDEERARAQDIVAGGVYRLEPYNVRLTVRNASSSESPILLAALDGAGPSPRFVTLAAFAAHAIQTVVRILRDSRTGTETVYVLSADPAHRQGVEIGISDQRGEVTRVRVNDDGVGSLASGVKIDWASARLLLVTSPAHRP